MARIAPKAVEAAKTKPTVLPFPGSPYRLHETFSPAGDQPEAIEGLLGRLSG